MLSVQVRSLGEAARDSVSMVVSRAATGLGLRVVEESVASENESICRKNTCGKFRTLRKGKASILIPACDACNCSGKNLLSKWKDAAWYCPLKLWDNRGKGVVRKRPIPTQGDSHGP